MSKQPYLAAEAAIALSEQSDGDGEQRAANIPVCPIKHLREVDCGSGDSGAIHDASKEVFHFVARARCLRSGRGGSFCPGPIAVIVRNLCRDSITFEVGSEDRAQE